MNIVSAVTQILKSQQKAVHLNSLEKIEDIFSLQDFENILKNDRIFTDDILVYEKGSRVEGINSKEKKYFDLFRNSRRMNNEVLFNIYQKKKEGIKITNIHEFSPKLQALRRSMIEATMSRVTMNSYFSPREQVGPMLNTHRDPYNIVILQVSGQKQFFCGNINSTALQAEDYSIVLSPNEGLYLPKQIPHYALPVESDSLHVTIGLHPLKFSEYFDFMKEQDLSWAGLLDKELPLSTSGELNKDDVEVWLNGFSELMNKLTLEQGEMDKFVEYVFSLKR